MMGKQIETSILSYTAGIIDGEGSIGITKYKDSECRSGYYYKLIVSVGNTNQLLTEWLHFIYGGYVYHAKSKNPKWKDAWIWHIGSRQAALFLESILPYLIIKKPQAELALEFQKGKTPHKIKTVEENALDEIQRTLMSKYNKKGQ